jgi:hypothetical protein
MTDTDLLSAMTGHYHPSVQQGLLCGNFQRTQEVLGFLAKLQGLGGNKDKISTPKFDPSSGENNRRPQSGNYREDRARDRRNGVNVRYIRGQSERQNIRNNYSRPQFYGRRQGRDEREETVGLNPAAITFEPQDVTARNRPATGEQERQNTSQNLNQ